METEAKPKLCWEEFDSETNNWVPGSVVCDDLIDAQERAQETACSPCIRNITIV